MTAPFVPNHAQRRNRVMPYAHVKRHLFEILMQREHGCCIWCRRRVIREAPTPGLPYPRNLATLDRVIPGAQGGTYEITNLVLACNGCNHDRGDAPALAYAARRGVVLPDEVMVALAARTEVAA